MKKKVTIILIAIAIILAVVATIILISKKREEQMMREVAEQFFQENSTSQGRTIELVGKKSGKDYVENEVICDAETEEIARQVAEKCEGELASYQDGIAVIKLDCSVEELFAKLENNAADTLPRVYPNYVRHTSLGSGFVSISEDVIEQ